MSTHISPDLIAKLHRFGNNNSIHNGGEFHFPERIAIDNSIYMSAPYTLYAGSPYLDEEKNPVIVIRDGCHINMGLQIMAKHLVQLERNVLIAPNVIISDWINVPVAAAQEKSVHFSSKGIIIGEGSWIGTNAKILGQVKIGTGSVVKPNSIVYDNVPDYCVVAGCPASIVQLYDSTSNQWLDIATKEEADKILTSRKLQPLLSICIPTYNRANCLDACLNSIFSQVPNNDLIEVIVSDNASTDSTAKVAKRYCELYPNLKYVRNTENIGGDRNILAAMQLGSGKFIKLQGDDDFFVDNTIQPLLHVLYQQQDCGIIFVNVLSGDGAIVIGEGMNSYLAATSFYATFITSLVFRREELQQIADPQKFISSSYNQLYLQYGILELNPRFCIMNCSMFTYAGMASEVYNYGGAIIRGYLTILEHYVGKGLSEDAFNSEKKFSLFNYVLPGFRAIVAGTTLSDLTSFEETYVEFYQNESYFEEGLSIINSIRPWSPRQQ
ncbi:glycosyltransferase [Paenibacillus sp. FSL K6-2524]|uniref:glycosyltransferase n=1 Tax=Paenibacillus sp. FSL K6-2524 TaxID=2954516 RepID=UPI0030F92C29